MKIAATTIVRVLLVVTVVGLLGSCYGAASCYGNGCCTSCGWTVCTGWWCWDSCYDYGPCYWSTLDEDPLAPGPEEVW